MSLNTKVEQSRKELLDKMVSLIKSGKLNWERGWNVATLSPVNPVSGTVYKGGNRLRLMINTIDKEYEDPRYMTFVQAKQKGWSVKSGEKGVLCEKFIFTKEVTVKDDITGEKKKEVVILDRPIINYFYVYNAAQIDGIPELSKPPVNTDKENLDVLENLIKASPCPVMEKNQSEAYYSPVNDVIVMPKREKFKSNNDFIKTLAHEEIHSTGKKERLGRDLNHLFGSPGYAREELRAELGSVFLTAGLGLPSGGNVYENNAAYLQSWLEALGSNPDELFRAASDAEKAADYIKNRYELVLDGIKISSDEEVVETEEEKKVSAAIRI